jgi:hypothetical protein
MDTELQEIRSKFHPPILNNLTDDIDEIMESFWSSASRHNETSTSYRHFIAKLPG